MRNLWNALSFVAMVHLLAIALFGGWMWRTERLSRERVETVRSLFAVSVPEAERRAEEAAAEAAIPEDAEASTDGRSAARRLADAFADHESREQAIRRLKDEKRLLLEQLERQSTDIDEERAAFERERSSWLAATDLERQQRTDEQRARAVSMLEGLPPKQAMAHLVALSSDGRMDQAVAYLNDMSPRVARKVLAQFRTDAESRLATELLERIRTLGMEAGGSGGTEAAPEPAPDADQPPDSAPAPAFADGGADPGAAGR
ncbi:MAG: hypothetical protein ACYTG1_01275 [Planctomycetota bacterium]|jgi:hypothetical protein